ncbi:unnamed protein product [Owenia fusiformis]|uniref:Uncharacterized protein n=1 Tax=Owenia fusiformis TaxID=6347 RepID=A0A8J1XQM4_OWEFU|nr:unnamed protein product [Owenia fusiformis]
MEVTQLTHINKVNLTLNNVSYEEVNQTFTNTCTTNCEAGNGIFYYSGAEELKDFQNWYSRYHGYIAATICILGIVANLLNIVVLTQKNMISATNCILTALAVADGLTMLAYFPFALFFYCIHSANVLDADKNSLSSTKFLFFYAAFSTVVHSIAIWLTVTLAIFRFMFIKYPRYGPLLCSLPRAKLAVALVYLVTFIFCIPNIVALSVVPYTKDELNRTIWLLHMPENTMLQKVIVKGNFWIQAIVIKLGPCAGLTVLSFLLIQSMREAEQRRKNLRAKSVKPDDDNRRDRKTNRTTRMLLAVVILFLITEMPQGILMFLTGVLDTHFFKEIYDPLGDFMDILALINNGINFILYCTMSKQFRETFLDIFLKPVREETRRLSTGFTMIPTQNGKISDSDATLV